MMVAMYKGKVVSVSEYKRQDFEFLQIDAGRIMGYTRTKRPDMSTLSYYLEPPKKDSETWRYATRILALEWPVVKIWVIDEGPLAVNESDLEDLRSI